MEFLQFVVRRDEVPNALDDDDQVDSRHKRACLDGGLAKKAMVVRVARTVRDVSNGLQSAASNGPFVVVQSLCPFMEVTQNNVGTDVKDGVDSRC